MLNRQRLLNTLQSAAILAAMALLLGALGWLIGGSDGAVIALIGGLVLVFMNPTVAPKLILRMYRAQRLGFSQAPRLMTAVGVLSKRAGLSRAPEIYYLPSPVMNAFALGTREHSAIALSDGMLRNMTLRELIGVLGHEISHVRNNDTWVMGLADLFSRMTGFLANFGLILVFINLPLMWFSGQMISWWTIALLIFAPTLSALLQLALSRTREYDADAGSAQITGDPRALSSALGKMEHIQGRILERLFMPGRGVPKP